MSPFRSRVHTQAHTNNVESTPPALAAASLSTGELRERLVAMNKSGKGSHCVLVRRYALFHGEEHERPGAVTEPTAEGENGAVEEPHAATDVPAEGETGAVDAMRVSRGCVRR